MLGLSYRARFSIKVSKRSLTYENQIGVNGVGVEWECVYRLRVWLEALEGIAGLVLG